MISLEANLQAFDRMWKWVGYKLGLNEHAFGCPRHSCGLWPRIAVHVGMPQGTPRLWCAQTGGSKPVWINGRKHLIMGFLKITFFELKFIHNATHPFKVYNSTVFNICPRECNPIAYKKVQNISIIFPFPKKPYSSGTSTVSLHHPPHQPPCGHSLSLLLGSHTLWWLSST